MSIEQEIKGVNEERMAALRVGDAGKLDQLLSEDLSSTTASGYAQTKAEILADVRSGALKVSALEADDFKVRVYGDTAVVTYRATTSATYEGESRSGQYRSTSVYVKQQGRWRLVAQQNTLVPQVAPQ